LDKAIVKTVHDPVMRLLGGQPSPVLGILSGIPTGGHNKMQTAHELFLHELGDILNAERNLVDALEEQADAVTDEQLKKSITDHRAQTEKQVERLEQVFADLGEEPEEAECKGVKGLVDEWKSFKEEEDPSDDILNVVTISAATKVESYEINAYESLIAMATDMDHTKAVKLLQQNLKEEQQTLKKMQAFAKKIKPENSGMDEIDEESEEGIEASSESEDQDTGRSRSKKSTSRKGRKAA
jgi:ferritin-like metal-binding protein YciE